MISGWAEADMTMLGVIAHAQWAEADMTMLGIIAQCACSVGGS